MNPRRLFAVSAICLALSTLAGRQESSAAESSRPSLTLSQRLVNDGAKTIASEVSKDILDDVFGPRKWWIPLWNISSNELAASRVVDVADNFISAIGEAAEAQPGAVPAIKAFLSTLAVEILVSGEAKIVLSAGKIMVGAVAYEVAVLDENYREAVANRFLEGRGGFMEKYRSYLRGVTPFYQWGVARQQGLHQNLDNLLEVFPTEHALREQWRLYHNWILTDFGGRGENRRDVENELGQAGSALLEIWKSQREERAVLRAAEYARQHRADYDQAINRELQSYAQAAQAVVSVTRSRTFEFTGTVSGPAGASLSGQELYLKFTGPRIQTREALRIQGITVGADGKYRVQVRGIRPGMTNVEFGVGREGGPQSGIFRYRGSRVLPVFPAFYAAFDGMRWDEVTAPPDEIPMNIQATDTRRPIMLVGSDYWRSAAGGGRNGGNRFVIQIVGDTFQALADGSFQPRPGTGADFDLDVRRIFYGTFTREPGPAIRGTLVGNAPAIGVGRGIPDMCAASGPLSLRATLADSVVTGTINGNGHSASFRVRISAQ